ncbi:MAG: endolytic transglycosylase MltG [Gaiellales bacterium]
MLGVLVLVALLAVGVLGLRALGQHLFDGGQTSSTPPPPTHVRTVRLLIPEGFAIRDIARRVPTIGLSSKSYRAAVAAAHPPPGYRATGNERLGMEGFLFPATYELTRPVSGKVLVAEQIEAFRRETAGVDFRYAARHGLTRYDVLIIASMIEREAAAPVDRAKISAVIYNRLRDHDLLGIDATVQYAAGSWAPVTEHDLQRNSPYNTRKFKGLPPTPICNPGLASIEAAAHPDKVPYLYYVAIPHDPQRRHFFTASFATFNAYLSAHGLG